MIKEWVIALVARDAIELVLTLLFCVIAYWIFDRWGKL
jgi:hypothetical protein